MHSSPTTITGVATMIALLLLPALTAIGIAIVPWVAGRHEVFGVTVPPDTFADARIRRYRIVFSIVVGALGAVSVLACFVLWRLAGVTMTFWCASVLSVLVMIAGFAIQQRFRRRVIAIKRERGWTTAGAKRMVIADDDMIPRPLTLWWDLVYVLVIAATITVGYAGYDHMPQRVPIHMDAAGIVNGWADKSPSVIWFAPLMELMLAAVMTGAHAAVLYAKRQVNTDSPTNPTRRYATMARAWSVYVLLVGVVTTLGIGMTIQLGTIGVLDLGLVGLTGAFAGAFALIGGIMVMLFYGQHDSHIGDGTITDDDSADGNGTDGGTMPRDEDRYWYGGIIYVNRDDPTIWVPKRFGSGWTVNMGRPAVWVGTVILLILVIALPFVFTVLL